MAELHMRTHYDRHYYPFATTQEVLNNYTNLVADFEISLIKKTITTRKRAFLSKQFKWMDKNEKG